MNLIKRDAGVTLDDFAKDRIILHALEARSVRLLYNMDCWENNGVQFETRYVPRYFS